uniref:hypothetical protein n=1 Tax=Kribbia dieselivorans TaxID=331526 RepID=UPI0008382772
MPLDHLATDSGRELMEALLRPQVWRHRRIDSLRLMEDQTGRRRVSIDCTPPAAPALAYYPQERRRGLAEIVGPLVIPVGLMEKGPLRHFDISIEGEGPIPILGRNEYRPLMVDALIGELGDAGAVIEPREHSLKRALESLVDGDPESASEMARGLIETGMVGSERVLDPKQLSQPVGSLLEVLARRFAILALVPPHLAGGRTVIKYSYYWKVEPTQPPSLADRLLSAAGFRSLPLNIETGGAGEASSFHLEIHAPSGVVIRSLTMSTEGANEDLVPRNAMDLGPESVAHVSVNYAPRSQPGDAVALLQPARGVAPGLTVWVPAFAFWFLALALILPNGKDALLRAADGGATILLALPAVVAALTVRVGENRIASDVLLMSRLVVLAHALMLLIVAASLVGSLREPYLTALWLVFSITAGLTWAYFLLA